MEQDVGRLRRKFREGRYALFAGGARVDRTGVLRERYTALVDELVRDIYELSCASADRSAARDARSGLAIVATGGYGRGELSPCSDIDIAFVPSSEDDPWVEAAVHVAFRLVMDLFLSFREVHVGYSYRPLTDASTWDLVTRTALLDTRFLCGDESLVQALKARVREVSSPLDLLLEVSDEADRLRRDSGNSLYSVEPDLKEGAGSLRDLHRGRWLYEMLLGVEQQQLFATLEARGILSAEQTSRVRAAAEWFWAARNWLHVVTGKRSDVIINNFQDRMAQELGAGTAQAWLAQHYAHAETLADFRAAAVRHTLAGPVQLGDVTLRGGAFHVAGGGADTRAVRVFHLAQRYKIPVALDVVDALARQPKPAAAQPEADEAWAFLGILREDRGVSNTLRQLARLGLVDRFVAGYSQLMRFVPPDPAHRYTVGEHSLRIVERLEALRAGTETDAPRFCELMAQCSHFDVLCLAALLHDSGKMVPGDEHSETGLALTRQVAERLGLAPEKRELLEILVRHHLLLVRTGRLQDLKSQAVIQGVAEKFPNVDALRHLYVFTYADTKSVAEKNWTSMDHRDQEELYQKVQNVLTGNGGVVKGAVEDRLGQIRRRLASSKLADEEAVARHCDSMPASYVLNTPLDEISMHLQLLTRLDEERTVLDVYNRPGDDYSELTICTYDEPQPGLLAKITGVLYGCNVDIHKAQVFTMEKENPVVLDTLWIRSAGHQVSEHRAGRIRSALKEVLSRARTLDEFLASAGKRPPEAIPLDSIELRNDLSEEHTVVHIIARDLQGLLFLMTRALSRSGLHIHSAKVATWNGRAENNFYVTTLGGAQIPGDDLRQWQQRLSRSLLGG